MSYIVKDNKKEYTPAPEGLHQAVCIDVVDLGIQKTFYGDKVQIEIRWVIEEIDPKTNKPHMLLKRFTPSLHKKANLRSTLEAWRGKKFTDEELKGFDIEKLLGANCQVQVIHNIAGEGEVYANVQAVVPIAKNAARLEIPSDYIRVAEREKRDEFERNPDGTAHGTNGRATDDYVPF
jgi:hypothetical protein